MYFNCHYLLFSNENITWVRIDFLIEKKCHKKANFISKTLILLSTHVYICIFNIYCGTLKYDITVTALVSMDAENDVFEPHNQKMIVNPKPNIEVLEVHSN